MNMKKRVTYSEKAIQTIIKAIKAGATSAVLAKEFNVKTRQTVKKWLDNYYTVKKGVAQKIYKQLLANDKAAEESVKLEMAEQEAAFMEEDEQPVVDYLLDTYMSPNLVKKALEFFELTGATYQTIQKGKGKFVTIQAICLGYPKVVTNHEPYKYYCDWDGIETIHPNDLGGIQSEIKDEEWAKEEILPFHPKKKGRMWAEMHILMDAFATNHGVEVDSLSLQLVRGNEEKNVDQSQSIVVKQGDVLRFISDDAKTCICWEVLLTEDGTFKEVAYKRGDSTLKSMILSA